MIVGIAFVVLMVLGMPIGFALGVAGVIGLYDMGGGMFLVQGYQGVESGTGTLIACVSSLGSTT